MVKQELKNFAIDWEFKQITSSPHLQQSNGRAEAAVKESKLLLSKALSSNADFYKSLYCYGEIHQTKLVQGNVNEWFVDG